MSKTQSKDLPKRNPRGTLKGRQPSAGDVEVVHAVLSGATLTREMLIEHLHVINDRFGHLSSGHIAALAQLMGLAQIDVYETATFYAHFTVTDDHEDQPSPPHMTLRICDGPACRMAGAKDVLKEALAAFSSQVRIVAAPCQGACDTPPSAILGRHRIAPATKGAIALNMGAPLETLPPPSIPRDPGPLDLGHAIETLARARLRGLGGAGFPTAKKWAFFKTAGPERVLAVNADEGEPGTFKDRYLLENHLDQVLDGMMIAARALDVQDVFFYLRDEYTHLHASVKAAFNAIEAPGITLHLRRGAGAYICGEETALIESLEGKRGLPRNRPPYPAQSGYLGRPTITQNVETLYWVSEIWTHGPEMYTDEGRPRFYSVSGRVRQPGVYLAPSTATVMELIEAADGMENGHTFTAFLPGGASGGIFPARMADLAMDFGVFEKLGGFVGSGALTVLSDQDDVWNVARTLGAFFAEESCGQCTPCRVGTQKLLHLINDPKGNEALIRDLASAMFDASICGLGQAAANPALTLLDHFEEDEP